MKTMVTLTIQTEIESKDDDDYQKKLNKFVLKLEKQGYNVSVEDEDFLEFGTEEQQ